MIYEYRAIPPFLRAMLDWRKRSDADFSIRAACRSLPGCSPSLVTLLAAGKRKLTRDRVPVVSRLLALPRQEELFLDQWIAGERTPCAPDGALIGDRSPALPPVRGALTPHLLSDWLNIFVKDAAGLRGFRPDPVELQRRLGGIASAARITRALKFLLRHGYLRRALDGRVVKNDAVLATMSPPTGAKARIFHRKTLEIARAGIERIPTDRRHASAIVMSLDERGARELRDLLNENYERLLQFMEAHGGEGEGLYQVITHLTPIASPSETTNRRGGFPARNMAENFAKNLGGSHD